MTSRRGPADEAMVVVAHPGSELYGSDRMLAESVSGLVEAGARVVVALPHDGPLVSELRDRGAQVQILPMPVLRKSALTPRGGARLVGDVLRSLGPSLRLLREQRPSTVYVSTLTIPTWLALGRAVGALTVCHVHEAERHERALVTRGLALPLLLAHRLLVNSRFSASVLTDSIERLDGRISVVLNGVAAPAAARPPRERLDGGLRILVPGRVSPRKGTDVALRALESLSSELSAHMEVLGSVFPGYEWFEADLRDIGAAAQAEGRLTMTAFDPDVWTHIADADVVVVPSSAPEPFGNTAVEALLAGRPVVVSDIGGLPEAVSGSSAAIGVAPRDPVALAGALERMAADWPRWSRAAWEERAQTAERFAPSRYRREIAAHCVDAVRPPRQEDETATGTTPERY